MNDFLMGTYQKRLWQEMNDYAENTGMDERFTPRYVREHYSEQDAKKIVKEHTLPLMFSDYVQSTERKKKKSTKSKTKRKKKGCGCK